MTICVFDQVTGNGSGADCRIVGFLRLILTQVRLTGNNPVVKGQVAGFTDLHGLVVSSWGWDSPNIHKVELVQ